jgi:hypothetical protein
MTNDGYLDILIVVAARGFSDHNFEMDAIHFQSEGGSDNTIRVPEGIRLPAGPLDVTVVPCAKPVDLPGDLATTRAWLLDLAVEAERDDLAANHDYYAHGKPRE